MTLLRKTCSVVLLCALPLGLGACGRKGPLEAPPHAAVPGSPGTPVAGTTEGTGQVSGQGTPEPEGAGGNAAWSPVANRSAGVYGGTNWQLNRVPAAKERSRLDWLLD